MILYHGAVILSCITETVFAVTLRNVGEGVLER